MKLLKVIIASVFLAGMAPSGSETPCAKPLRKIALTGSPSGGKTTLISALFENDPRVLFVPEAATLLFSGGFPAPQNMEQQISFQRLIVHLQHEMEQQLMLQNPSAEWMIVDRTALDGYAFTNLEVPEYLKAANLSLIDELNRYHAVIFFEIPNRENYGGNNPHRYYDYLQALPLTERIRNIWARHPNLITFPAFSDFQKKISVGVEVIQKIKAGVALDEIKSIIAQ